MRLTRLELTAFGPFSDQLLEFSSTEPGLHIVFGANEAGKSSSLRALKALLFGFEERTKDNFIHANPQLLVGGCIQGPDGQDLVFYRRKKRTADLLDANKDPMDASSLVKLLPGVELALFESLYGINHEALVIGGADILSQKGDVGQALFSAGSGISSLRNILGTLNAEAEELFKNQGSKPEINKAIATYKKLQKQMRKASLPSSQWHKHNKQLQEYLARKDELDGEYNAANAEFQRLSRLQKVIPVLAELDSYQTQFAPLADVVLLPDNFQEQLQRVEQNKRDENINLGKDKEHLQKLQDVEIDISLRQDILDNVTVIEDLYQRLGEYHKGQKDIDKLDGMRIINRKDAGRLLTMIQPDLDLDGAVDSLRPVLGKQKAIQSLLSRRDVLSNDERLLQDDLGITITDIEDIEQQLAALPSLKSVTHLIEAVKVVHKAGDIDGFIKTQQLEIKIKEQECQDRLQQLGLWSGELTNLPSLALPLSATIKKYEISFADILQERKLLLREQEKLESEQQKAQSEINKLELSGVVLSEEDLQTARQKRDDGWQLLRRQWVNKEDVSRESEVYAPGVMLHEAYERQIDDTDHVSDRLRFEADRVARAASLRADIADYKVKLQDSAKRLSDQEVRQSLLETEWQKIWQPLAIAPLSPSEMSEWLVEMDKLLLHIGELAKQKEDFSEKVTERILLRNKLDAELLTLKEKSANEGNELSPILLMAESICDLHQTTQRKQEKLEDQQRHLVTSKTKIKRRQSDFLGRKQLWQNDWQQILADLTLPTSIKPEDVLDHVESIGKLFAKIDASNELVVRIAGIKRDAEEFNTDLQDLLKVAAPELQGEEVRAAVLSLHKMLNHVNRDKETLQKNQQAMVAIQAEITDTEKTIASLEEEVQEFLVLAKCEHVVDLQDVIRRFLDHKRLRDKMSDLEAEIARASDGVSLVEIRIQAELVDIDELPARINSLQQQIENEIRPQIDKTSENIGEERKEIAQMNGGTTAAEIAEEMEQVAAEIQHLVDLYARLRFASSLLTKEIEHYREEHQGPVIKIASALFSQMTLNSFAGLRVDVNDKGAPILIGERPNGNRLEVDAMSSGTRDQLYLALRIATLKWRLQSSDPMPFIVDDILINFDDDRSEATLKVLADLSAENQVIMFTHHQKVVDAAQNLKKNEIIIHEL